MEKTYSSTKKNKAPKIKPGNELSERFCEALIDKQGDDSLTDLSNDIETHAGSLKRMLQSKDGLKYPALIFKACKWTGKSPEYILLGLKAPNDTVNDRINEYKRLYVKEKKKREEAEKKYTELWNRIKSIKNPG